jgi:hypothetical protein
MHSYVLTRAGARRLLVHRRYPQFAYSRAIDVAVSWLIQSGRVKSFSVVPSVVSQRKMSGSDITDGTGIASKIDLMNGVFSRADGLVEGNGKKPRNHTCVSNIVYR